VVSVVLNQLLWAVHEVTLIGMSLKYKQECVVTYKRKPRGKESTMTIQKIKFENSQNPQDLGNTPA